MKSAVRLVFVAGLWMCGVSALAQGPSVVLKGSSEDRYLTGNARVDFAEPLSMYTPGMAQEQTTGEQPYRSPWIAAGLSAVLPGAGEFYAESYWKAAAFLAIEVAVWSIAYSYDKRGDRQTDYYQDFANKHWSVVKYAEYALDKWEDTWGLPAARRQYYEANLWIGDRADGRPPWHKVNWAILNEMEREIARTSAGQYYSHTLPLYGEQQYFELIGKYQQYNQGWNDAPPTYNYPEPVTSNFLFYSKERGKANDYYATASTAVTIGILNHILSAVDAAWSASSFNKNFHARVGLQTIPLGDRVARVPVAKLSYTF